MYQGGMSHLTSIFAVWDGNAEALAEDIGESGVMVRQWRSRNSIPPRYWIRIMERARRRGARLKWTDFLHPDDRMPVRKAAA